MSCALLGALALWQASPIGAEWASTDAGTVLARGAWPSADGPAPAVLAAALEGYERAVALSLVSNRSLLTVIDYTRPSTERRLWVLDLDAGRVLYHELVAHGRNSGGNVATDFSNEDGSKKSSLGLFVSDKAYYGQNGYSLRLRGLDPGVNDQAYARAIVMHGAAYVSEAIAERLGRLGRSWGCPALRTEVARGVIDLIKNGSVVYAYGPRLAAATAR